MSSEICPQVHHMHYISFHVFRFPHVSPFLLAIYAYVFTLKSVQLILSDTKDYN